MKKVFYLLISSLLLFAFINQHNIKNYSLLEIGKSNQKIQKIDNKLSNKIIDENNNFIEKEFPITTNSFEVPCFGSKYCFLQDDPGAGRGNLDLTCSSNSNPDYHYIKRTITTKKIEYCTLNLTTTTILSPSRVTYDVEVDTFGDNWNSKVNDTTLFPHKAISYIETYFSKGNVGSGALVGKNLLLTAAHAVYDTSYGFSSKIIVIPGSNNIEKPITPFGQTEVNEIYVPKDYYLSTNKSVDYAYVVLNDSIASETGYFGLKVKSKSEYSTSTSLYVAGYPGQEPQKYQTAYQGKFKEIANYGDKWSIIGNFVSFGGLSGSPMFLTNNYISGVLYGNIVKDQTSYFYPLDTTAVTMAEYLNNK